MKNTELILYGAFDRYNYGDNLMPIVFVDYFRSAFPDRSGSTNVIFASIRDSDLSRYGCKKTIAIRKVVGRIESGCAVVVVGGEVLCARNENLFIHAQSNVIVSEFLKRLKWRSMTALRVLANIFYPCPWSFSYIPKPSRFNAPVNIAYNSVGGVLTSELLDHERNEILASLNQSVHFSVRDQRTCRAFESFVDTHLVPDSVIILSSLYSLDDIERRLSSRFQEALPTQYIVLQAAPEKARGQLNEVARQIDFLHQLSGLKIVLLPIGYATGHDDLVFLKKLNELRPEITTVMQDLSLWEILYAIAKADIYYGTSLHGAITAMSYNVPHFGLNPKISKLNDYLKLWSVQPFNGCIEFSQIAACYQPSYDEELHELHAKVLDAQQLTRENIGTIVDKLFPSSSPTSTTCCV